MRNVNTKVKTRRGGNAMDIAIEKKGYGRRSIRYDVRQIKLENGFPVIETSRVGVRYQLLPDEGAAAGGRAAPAKPVRRELTTAHLREFALGRSVVIDGRRYNSLTEYEANTAPRAQRGGCANVRNRAMCGPQTSNQPVGEPLAITRVSPRLAEAVGFTPKAAVRL